MPKDKFSYYPPKFRRSFKSKLNLRADPRLLKYAYDRKKPKWSFLLSQQQHFNYFDDLHQFKRPLQRLSRNFALSWEAKQALKEHFLISRESAWKAYANKTSNINHFYRAGPSLPQDKIHFLSLWESRLDTSLWKSLLAASLPESRQLILHGFITVNYKKITKPSYPLKKGDFVQIHLHKKLSHFKEKRITIFQNLHKFYKGPLHFPFTPAHLEVHFISLSFVFVDKANPFHIYYPYPLNLSNLQS